MNKKLRKESKTAKKIVALIFVFISVFCAVFFAARNKFFTPVTDKTAMAIVAPFQRIFAWAGSQLAFVKSTVTEISTLHEQNKLLREEVELLRAQNLTASEYASENQRLRNLLGYKQVSTQFDLVAASVIGRESATWSSIIIINRGTLDGVADNMAVVTEMGLVGHVMEAGINSSKVQLLLDPRSKMVNIPKDSDVQVDDMVVTSGFGGVYPKGIVVGKIVEVHNEEGGLLKYGVVDTSVDFQKLEDVAIIVASREAPPEPLQPPPQTPGTETDPYETAKKLQDAQQQIQDAQQQVQDAQQQQLQQAGYVPEESTPAEVSDEDFSREDTYREDSSREDYSREEALR